MPTYQLSPTIDPTCAARARVEERKGTGRAGFAIHEPKQSGLSQIEAGVAEWAVDPLFGALNVGPGRSKSPAAPSSPGGRREADVAAFNPVKPPLVVEVDDQICILVDVGHDCCVWLWLLLRDVTSSERKS